jgi:hypothetical protein
LPTHPIAVKPLKQPAGIQPSLIGLQFRQAVFEDWTEDGNILATVDTHQLAVFDKYGKLLHTIETPREVGNYTAGSASYRKYLHR